MTEQGQPGKDGRARQTNSIGLGVERVQFAQGQQSKEQPRSTRQPRADD